MKPTRLQNTSSAVLYIIKNMRHAPIDYMQVKIAEKIYTYSHTNCCQISTFILQQELITNEQLMLLNNNL